MARYARQIQLFNVVRNSWIRNSSINTSRSLCFWTQQNSTESNSILCQPSVTASRFVPQRHFLFKALNRIYNSPDQDRIKEVGPERACAEWCLKCGAHIRWAGARDWITEFGGLPITNDRKLLIEEIDAKEAGFMDVGFSHLHKLSGLKRFRFYKCPYFVDRDLEELQKVKHTLEVLEIESCVYITDQGLRGLSILEHLKELVLQDLPGVENMQECVACIQKQLPHCKITVKT